MLPMFSTIFCEYFLHFTFYILSLLLAYNLLDNNELKWESPCIYLISVLCKLHKLHKLRCFSFTLSRSCSVCINCSFKHHSFSLFVNHLITLVFVFLLFIHIHIYKLQLILQCVCFSFSFFINYVSKYYKIRKERWLTIHVYRIWASWMNIEIRKITK